MRTILAATGYISYHSAITSMLIPAQPYMSDCGAHSSRSCNTPTAAEFKRYPLCLNQLAYEPRLSARRSTER